MREHTHEILIDEYQDTNDFQEILISLLAKDNVYMVGDVKQSIYRFRNANPEIFKQKYRAFKQEGAGLAIDLSRNFRSRKDFGHINMIFRQVMDSELSGSIEGVRNLFSETKHMKTIPRKRITESESSITGMRTKF